MFKMNTEDVNYIFDQAAQTVMINDVPRNAIISNPQMNDDETRYIHTLDRVLQGDLILIEGNDFLTVTESITKRGAKYKSKVQHCNHIIEVAGEITEVLKGYNPLGHPVYEYIQGDPVFIPSIVQSGTFNIDNGNGVLVANDVLFVTVQDNVINRSKLTVNQDVVMFGKSYSVQHQDLTRQGLLVLRFK